MITGLAGLDLSADERAFLAGESPWGVILFARNIEGAAQLADLVAAARDVLGRENLPVFIDQEGGRVQRLRPPLAPNYPPARAIGDLYLRDRAAGLRAAWLLSALHACDLARYGINADCLPVLDVPVEGAHDVIGNRAYGLEPEMVAALGRGAMDGLMENGVLPVVKHIPGHGRAFSDSHHALPVVDAGLDELRLRDFAPFAALKDAPAAMTAHVVFTAVDADDPVTTSRRAIGSVIRTEIGFDGLLMSDDLSMKALKGTFEDRAARSIAAGCDVVLHCNGDFGEMRAVASAAPLFAGRAKERAAAAEHIFARPLPAQEDEWRREFAALLETAAAEV